MATSQHTSSTEKSSRPAPAVAIAAQVDMGRLRRLAQSVYRRLLRAFGEPDWGSPMAPIDELVSTILSQNTSDTNRDRAYTSLRRRFPTWEQVRDATPERVIEVIRVGGLANQKGPRIQAVLREISAERGNLDLSFLSDIPLDDARRWLTKFHGVGPKTAAIVLQFSLGRPAFPVDTHIYRVTGRIGLRPLKMSVEQAHVHLEKLFRPEQYYAGHLNLIRLGRQVCHPHKPDCPHCPVRDVCEYEPKTI